MLTGEGVKKSRKLSKRHLHIASPLYLSLAVSLLLAAWFWLCGWQPGMGVGRKGNMEIGKQERCLREPTLSQNAMP